MVPNFLDSVDKLTTEVTIRRFRICGIVQGVGFRPFVHRLAKQYDAYGWVLNDSQGVLVELQTSLKNIRQIVSEIEKAPPPLAKVISVNEVARNEPLTCYKSFEIRKSNDSKHMETIVPPDSNVCRECLSEMRDPSNRRYRYAFINCTNCGPRYSIIMGMPYDRAKSTMNKFTLCHDCEQEYEDANDRRYHAQPNACHKCGPSLQLTDNNGSLIETNDIVHYAISKLKEGYIFAIKSLGGFHLVADAHNREAVIELRKRKKRDSKPFAIMVSDSATALIFSHVNNDEERLLNCVQRPIVLLKKKRKTFLDSIAPHNPNIGVMLPSTPLQHLLLEDATLPVLVMTSGNLSGHPIAYKNDLALEQLSGIADYFIFNNRDIHTSVDDSVIKVITRKSWDSQDNLPSLTTFIRRSRGYAPYPIHLPYSVGAIAALGAELKTTVSLGKGNQVFISQHIGDLKNDLTFMSHINCTTHMRNLLSIDIKTIVCDMHPSFRSTHFALEQSGLDVVQVQHHHAHMASCMAENGLTGKTIGVIFDGTGYGPDQSIWGGEFLIGDYANYIRAGSLRQMLLLGGDQAVKEPIRVAISLLVEAFGESVKCLDLDMLNNLTEQQKDVYLKMIKRKINSPATSSMGRLFDGVSALLGICCKIDYEAQAAIELEAALGHDLRMGEVYEYKIDDAKECWLIDYRPMIKAIVQDVKDNVLSISEISRNFHSTIVSIIVDMCKRLSFRFNTNQIVLSGGVFCNSFLLSNTVRYLKSSKLNVFYHELVPTNDGGISLGQVVVAAALSKNTQIKEDSDGF